MTRLSLREAAWLTSILLFAGGLRLWYAVYLPGQGRDLLHSDMELYDESAWKMAQGLPVEGRPGFNGFHPLSASTYIYAGYVYFVAAIYAAFGHSPLAVRVVQSLIGTATVGLVYVVGASTFGRRAGRVAALLTAIYLPLVYYAGLLLSETWFLFLELAAVAAWLRACGRTDHHESLVAGHERSQPAESAAARSGAEGERHRPTSLLFAGLAGVFAGVACITRTAFLPAVAALALAGWWSQRVPQTRHRRTMLVVVLGLGASVAILPVTVRNWQIHGRFILVSTNGPSTFYVGHVTHTPFVPDERPGLSDVAIADEHRRRSWQYLKDHWPTYLAEIPEFFSEMWMSNDFWPNATTYWRLQHAFDSQQRVRTRAVIDNVGGPAFGRLDHFPDLVRYADRLIWIVVGLPLGLLAAFFLPRQHRRWLVIYAALLPYLLIPFLAPGFPRYRIPAVPFLFILAGQTVSELIRCRELRNLADKRRDLNAN